MIIKIGNGNQSKFTQPCNLSFIPFWFIITNDVTIIPSIEITLIAKNTVVVLKSGAVINYSYSNIDF